MDPTKFHAVYVDRRANCDRVEQRDGCSPLQSSSSKPNGIGGGGEGGEHWAVQQNIQALLLAFSSVSICTSAQSCISVLSDINCNDPNPLLLLLDVPLQSQPEDENTSHDGRHDSGIAAGPADMFGLPLLKFISAEIENMRMSNLIVSVALLTDNDSSEISRIRGAAGPRDDDSDGDDTCAARELQCVDSGAWDVLRHPLSGDNVKTLYLHCYRARKSVMRKARKRSWVGIDEPKGDNYSYLREKMVRELMTEICNPKKVKTPSVAGRVRISRARSEATQRAVGSWDFSAHDFSDDELVHCAQTMFEHAFTMPEVSNFAISSDLLVDFLVACRGSYNDQVPYHNFRHVVDVLQAVFFFMLQLGVLPRYDLSSSSESPPDHPESLSHIITPMDALTLLIVAIGHDVGHPGVNNAFLVTLKAPLAQVYNDKSVLESFHCAAFSQVLRRHWPKALDVRKMMIEMILATDMGLHFDFMGKMEKLRKKYEKDSGPAKWDDKIISDHRTLLCALLIKCADISNVARKHECSELWATILIDEFARQANIEHDLGIPSSLVAPPVTGSVMALAKSQVGFMNLFAIPLFENLSKVLPEMGFSVKELAANKDSWSKKIDLYTSQPEEKAQRALPPPPTSAPSGRLSPGGNNVNTSVSRHNLPPVLGTALMDSDMPQSDANTLSGSDIRSGLASPVLQPGVAVQHTHSGNGNATAVTVVVTHPKHKSARTNGYGPVSEKRPTYQHSTEHLRAGASSVSPSPDRPRSSPPDLGDCSDHSCSKGCCAGGGPIAPAGTVERRSSRFFKKVKLWKTWRKEPIDG